MHTPLMRLHVQMPSTKSPHTFRVGQLEVRMPGMPTHCESMQGQGFSTSLMKAYNHRWYSINVQESCLTHPGVPTAQPANTHCDTLWHTKKVPVAS